MARKLDIDWPELQFAFDSSFGEASCYLDRETGTVVTVTEDIRAAADDEGDAEAFDPQLLEAVRAIDGGSERYLPIPSQDARARADASLAGEPARPPRDGPRLRARHRGTRTSASEKVAPTIASLLPLRGEIVARQPHGDQRVSGVGMLEVRGQVGGRGVARTEEDVAQRIRAGYDSVARPRGRGLRGRPSGGAAGTNRTGTTGSRRAAGGYRRSVKLTVRL